MNTIQALICDRLRIDDFHFVEIEAKKRILPEQRKDVYKFLKKTKKVHHVKSAFFFDQFLDTPRMDLLKKGVSLRLRYKKGGTVVYLQYKGPGFLEEGLLYRSEFSSRKLTGVVLEESHHDMIRFTKTSLQNIIARRLGRPMVQAMKRHLGADVVANISMGPILCAYQKEKFAVDMGRAFLEPSLDQIFAFHISKTGLHPLSTFCEYENEIKAKDQSLNLKIAHIPDLLKFDDKLTEEFDLKPEVLDKYHRSCSIFLPRR
jgi:hypothetical protein